ncbi:hypothetical protein RB195_009686 [Necator americanus]|uniref:Histone-lysine N-methyltransferase SETMAR n=1 Tax=Necator americanus TaxID=51031 RepID=A0ABR1CV74_NECAM
MSSSYRPKHSIRTQKVRELGWVDQPQPPYRPDLAPSDYHLFKHLQDFLDGTKLASRESCKNEVVKFLANKDEDFFNWGALKLPSNGLKFSNKTATRID